MLCKQDYTADSQQRRDARVAGLIAGQVVLSAVSPERDNAVVPSRLVTGIRASVVPDDQFRYRSPGSRRAITSSPSVHHVGSGHGGDSSCFAGGHLVDIVACCKVVVTEAVTDGAAHVVPCVLAEVIKAVCHGRFFLDSPEPGPVGGLRTGLRRQTRIMVAGLRSGQPVPDGCSHDQ